MFPARDSGEPSACGPARRRAPDRPAQCGSVLGPEAAWAGPSGPPQHEEQEGGWESPGRSLPVRETWTGPDRSTSNVELPEQRSRCDSHVPEVQGCFILEVSEFSV